ncbi:MAG: ectoine/hydroxyectoine ABC transporter substrate-binding protein EhuB [Nitrospinae bacterium CG11_big_fil_rev_8_21_14_0_20_56_8]|nr:MAG: ectoine/hydroxyectoine ABC transporter substrate-binding protein EhuB [Nitrospinae bacterium CG11_big_fil_rev_8_21_14_0_20_56_8]
MTRPDRNGPKTGWPILLFFLSAFLYSACKPVPAGGTLERIRKADEIRVGYANEAPFAFMDPASGRFTGEAPEIARHVISKLGVQNIRGVLTEFSSLIPGLKAGRFDLIAAGMYVTPQRCREVDFSDPTYRVGEAFIVARGNPLGLHGYEDVAGQSTARLGLVAGTIELQYADAVGIPKDRIRLFPDVPSALAGVRAGRVEALGGTGLTVQDMLKKAGDPNLERADPFHQPQVEGTPVFGYGAFAFRKGDAAFREIFNTELTRFLGTEAHRAAVRPFGFSSDELPRGMTAEQLCQPS